MSEMFIMPGGEASAGQFAEATQRAATQHWAVPLQRTDEPVSREDERIEDQALQAQGEPVPVAADASFADAVLGEVTFGLPERLRAEDLTWAVTSVRKAAAWDYVGFRMTPSFAGPQERMLWRLQLSMKLFIPGEPDPQAAETSSALATAVYLEPQNILGQQTVLSGEVGFDLAEVAKLFPPLNVLKLHATMPFQVKKSRPVIRFSGMDKHVSSWFVADPQLTPAFHATVIAQLPAAQRFAIEAKLHVEIRKKVMGIPHRVYAISDPGVSLNYVRASRADTFVAINPQVPPSRLQAILLGENPVEPPPPAAPAGTPPVSGIYRDTPGMLWRTPATSEHNEGGEDGIPLFIQAGAPVDEIFRHMLGTPPDAPVPIDYKQGTQDVDRWLNQTSASAQLFARALSYTTFEHTGLNVEGGDTLTVTFTVTNTSDRPGAEVPRLYLTYAPDGPQMRLLGSERVELEPGKSRQVTMTADPRLLARLDDKSGQWRIVGGNYQIAVEKEDGGRTLTGETVLTETLFISWPPST